jgi:hypothetical protein
MRMHRDGGLDFAIRQNLHKPVAAFHNAALLKVLERQFRYGRFRSQFGDAIETCGKYS